MDILDSPYAAIYDTREKKWQFKREYRAAFRLHAVGSPTALTTSTPAFPSPSPMFNKRNLSQRQRDWRNGRWWPKYLHEDVPETASAMPWICDFVEESFCLTSSLEINNPAMGEVLKAGTALADNRAKKTSLLAYAGGESGCNLELLDFTQEPRCNTADGNAKVWLPTVLENKELPAHSFASPILQICFAETSPDRELSTTRMAVRTSGACYFYRTVGRRLPGARTVNRYFVEPLAIVDTPVVDCGPESADLVFNPWFEKQFAIIGKSGNWTVREFEGLAHRITKRGGPGTRVLGSGCLVGEDKLDAWNRICWGANVNSIMACDRRRAALFDIRESQSSQVLELLSKRERNWILDLKRPEGENHDAILLTSEDISWIDTRQPGRVLVKYPHRRHRTDTSLSMSLFREEDVTNLMVYSRNNSLITYHQLSRKADSRYPSVLDPGILECPTLKPKGLGSIGMELIPCKYKSSHDPKGEDEEQIRFFSAFNLAHDRSLSRRIYTTTSQPVSLVARMQMSREAPLPSSQYKSVEFIIDSDEEANATEEVMDTMRSHIEKEEPDGSHRRTDLSDIYGFMFSRKNDESMRTADDNDMEHSVESFCARAARAVQENGATGIAGVTSISKLCPPARLYSNLNTFEEALASSLAASEITEKFTRSFLLPSNSSTFPVLQHSDELFTITALYKSLISTFVDSLPGNLHSAARLRRERICRQVATEAFLCTQGIRLTDPLPAEPVKSPSDTAEEQPVEELTEDVIGDPAVEEQKYEPARPPEPPSLQALRKYVRLPVDPILPDNMERIVDAWKPGEDPADYEPFIDPEEGIPRYRKQRLKWRKERKALAASLGLEKRKRSRPGHSFSQADESQDASQEGIIMSQIERGRHGGRQDLKSKRRRTGF